MSLIFYFFKRVGDVPIFRCPESQCFNKTESDIKPNQTSFPEFICTHAASLVKFNFLKLVNNNYKC